MRICIYPRVKINHAPKCYLYVFLRYYKSMFTWMLGKCYFVCMQELTYVKNLYVIFCIWRSFGEKNKRIFLLEPEKKYKFAIRSKE